eukprot:CAMPEP_0184547898 /NCGR_PEP_ID=MMETSP0199_2-20130426/5866_1 /TAXON_ID=1112570 /ORGANISM="Thraustochytrium sp., Strain LLF1b" /LENGTH=378 /DNA_ID=CAMNT_0026942445 /DNA_START=145 /DNA_END=1281 /DNA_ORIENTATION=+
MAGEKRQRWADARRVDARANAKALLPIPEPVHRFSALASGQSLRGGIPRGTLKTIREACNLYEKKCAGKYSSDSLGARYVYELSREVQRMLVDVARTMMLKETRLKDLERTMGEWDSSFGPGHGSLDPGVLEEMTGKELKSSPLMVTPKRLKEQLDEHVEEIVQLKRELQGAEHAREALKDKLKAQMNEQARLMREQFQQDMAYSTQMHQNAIEALQRKHAKALAKVEQDLAHERARGTKIAVRSLEEKVNASEARAGALARELDRERALVKQLKDEEVRQWSELTRKAKAQVKQAHRAETKWLGQQIESLQKRLEEETSKKQQEVIDLERDTIIPLEESLERHKRTSKQLATENEYLRSRVMELNKMVKAMQGALAK